MKKVAQIVKSMGEEGELFDNVEVIEEEATDFRADFPTHIISKPNDPHVQSFPSVLDELSGLIVSATLMCGGIYGTWLMIDGEFHACSQDMSVTKGDNIYWKIAEKYGLEELLKADPEIVIQGEIVGEGVWKNPMGLKELELRVFNVYYRNIDPVHFSYRVGYLSNYTLERFCAMHKLPMVPIVATWRWAGHSVEDLLRLAGGKYEGTENQREGIVIRPASEEYYSRTLGQRLSFKVVNNEYLLDE